MSLVTGIEERRGIIEIAVEGRIAAKVRKAHFAKRPLAVGDEVDIDQYLESMAAIQFPAAYEAALSALDFSARSAHELEALLFRKGYLPAVARAVVERLLENRILDDKRFAARVAETQANKAVGLYSVKRKLRAKGISDTDAEEALSQFDDEQQTQACRSCAEKLARKYANLPVREARAKLSQALARRGFGWDAISGTLDAMALEEDFQE